MNIIWIDLVKSFGASVEEPRNRRIFTKSGEPVLSNSAWSAGEAAVGVLLPRIQDHHGKPSESIDALAQVLPSAIAEAEQFLDRDFFNLLLEMVASGKVVADVSSEELCAYWEDYDFPAKALLHLQFFNAIPRLIYDPETGPLIQGIAALSTLVRLDDCVQNSFELNSGLEDSAADVEKLRQFVSPSSSTKFALEAAGRAAIKAKASELATRRHHRSNHARAWVQSEWLAHRAQYDWNKSAFTRDYVRRVLHELDVKVTEKQMREVWLKDPPPAGKPAGQPADG